jgi:hypothetical protein
MDSHSLLNTFATHGVKYVLDGYGEPVFGPAVSSQGVRVIPDTDKNNMKSLAAALTQLDARMDPNRPAGMGGEIQAKSLAATLQGSWYLRLYTHWGKLELLHDYTHRVAGIVGPKLEPGEDVVAAVPVERAGKQKNVDLFMKVGALPGNLLRRKKQQRAAQELAFPDASKMVLAATTQRITAFQQQEGLNRFLSEGAGVYEREVEKPPDTQIGDVTYERLARVEAAKPEIVGAGIRRPGYIRFVFRDGNTHLLSSWSGGGSLFATAVNGVTLRRAGGGEDQHRPGPGAR